MKKVIYDAKTKENKYIEVPEGRIKDEIIVAEPTIAEIILGLEIRITQLEESIKKLNK